MWTHVLDLFDIAPLLLISSPTRRCGKTTFLDLVYRVSARGLMSSNITGPALFRTIEGFRPSLMIDEADAFTKLSDELRGLLNTSHRRSSAVVIRTVGDQNEPRAFSTWAPKAMTAIGAMPDSIEDRSIRVSMARKPAGVRKTKALGRAMDAASRDLVRKIARWTSDAEIALRSSTPTFVDALNDRAQDNWIPLLAVAEVCGPEVLERAKHASIALTGEIDGDVGELVCSTFGTPSMPRRMGSSLGTTDSRRPTFSGT